MTQHATGGRSRALFVSFSGIDGAGKSTQIEALRARLSESGMRVRIVTFWDDVARLKGIRETSGHKLFGGEKGVGSPEKPVNRRDKNVRSGGMTVVRLFLYLVDSISLRRVAKKVIRSDADFIIFDRYAYDELANLNLANPLARLYVRFIMSFVPKPDVSYFLDADPEAARARKPEYPVDFLHLSRASYKTLCALIGGITIIPPGPIAEVSSAVLKPVLAKLAAQGSNSRLQMPGVDSPAGAPGQSEG